MNAVMIKIMNDESDAREVAQRSGVPIADVRALRRVLRKLGDKETLSSVIENGEPATRVASRYGLRESDVRAIRNLAGHGRRRVNASVVSLRIRSDLALRVTAQVRRQLQKLVERELVTAGAVKTASAKVERESLLHEGRTDK